MGLNTQSRWSCVNAACKAMIDEGAQLVMAVMTDRRTIAEMIPLGFMPVPGKFSPKKFYTVVKTRPENATATQELAHIGNWGQTLGDWDNL